MATLQQIRERVLRKLKNPTGSQFSTAVIDSEINRAVRFYKTHRFWFNEELANITLVPDQQTVPSVPTDLISELQINGLMIIDEQVNVNLEKLSPDVFFYNDNEQTGRPSAYTYRDNEFLLLPIPIRAYTLVLRYLKNYTALVNDSDTNDFTNEAEDLIMLHTLKNMYAEDKQDSVNSAVYAEFERQEYKTLKRRDNNRLGSGQLYADTM